MEVRSKQNARVAAVPRPFCFVGTRSTRNDKTSGDAGAKASNDVMRETGQQAKPYRRMHKRGVYFTALAIVFVTVLFTLYTFQQPQQRREQSFVLDTRMFTMNHLVNDIEDDAGRMISVATYRALVAMEDDIANRSDYLYSVSSAYRELVVNGSLNGSNQSVMENNTFGTWVVRMENAATDVGLTLTLTNGPFSVDQVDPWTIAGFTNLTIFLRDPITTASWNVTRSVNGSVSIFLFEDPIYRVNTVGRVLNLIERTNITTFVSGTNTDNLMTHTNSTWYRPWAGAPSFLQRLEGKLTSSSPNGIESLVNLDEIQHAGMSIASKSVVDYTYF
ncbi:MAG TPA: hypothetical protein VLJ21_03000, partial [Candidatus Binatia bacterium]|nr:hypothetical protein [Candidatus Binatia bacterium]